jgi:glycosyltransferase involved in cell wall biosynthesis
VHTVLYCHHYTQISGGETSLLELFRHLDRSRFRLLLAAPPEGPFPEAARELGVEVIPAQYGSLRRLDLVARTAVRLWRVARARAVSLLHANGPVTNIPAALAARAAGLPAVWHARNLVVPGEEIDLDRLLLPLASLLIANSDAIRERFRRRGGLPEKTLTIINGVDVERFHPSVSGEEVRARYGAGPGEVLAGVVGRISPIKGQRTFIEAALRLIPRFPNLRFLIVGAGLFGGEKKCEEELRARVAAQGLGERVFFSGYQRDVRAHTAALDICVIPSDAEPCGRVIFEAMAMAKPVVGTSAGGTPEIAADGETGLLVPPRDPEALASAIARLAGDPALRRRMGEAGRRRAAERFTIQAHARRTEEAYLRLLEGTRG